MPNKVFTTFLKTLKQNISLFVQFQKIDDNKIYFLVENKLIVINIICEQVINNKFLPKFSFNSSLSGVDYLRGHVYNNGELCHNFEVKPFDKNNVIEVAKKFSRSLTKYIKSISIKKNIGISNLLETNLEKLEKLSLGSFYLLDAKMYNEVVEIGQKYIKIPNFNPIDPRIHYIFVDRRIKYIFIPKIIGIHMTPIHVLPIDPKNIFVVTKVEKNDITLENCVSKNIINKALKIYTEIPIKPSNKKLKVAIIGLGSVGSCILKSASQDIDVIKIFANDPDIYEPKNSFRSAFADGIWFHNKAKIASAYVFDQWSRKYKIKGRSQEPKYTFLSFAIGYRLTQDEQKQFLNVIEQTNYILDCTGQEDVFNYLAHNLTKPIFKIGLYSSGNIAIIGKYSNKNMTPETFSKKWEDKRLELNIEVDSAYNSNTPVTFDKTNLASAAYYQFFKTNYLNLNENKIEIFDANNLFKNSK